MIKVLLNAEHLWQCSPIVIKIFILSLFISPAHAGQKSQPEQNSPKPFGSNAKSYSESDSDFTREIVEGVIIIKFKSDIGISHEVSQINIPSINTRMTEHKGHSIKKVFPSIKSSKLKKANSLDRIHYFYYQSGEDPQQVAANFARDPSVEYAEAKYMYPILENPSDPSFSNMTQFPFIKADEAWNFVKGEQGEVVIAVVDGGTDWQHEDLQSNIWINADEIPGNGIDDDSNGFIDDIRGWNFANNSSDPKGLPNTPTNASHGTHVAGTAAALTNNDIGVSSISWNCTVMPINVGHPTRDKLVQYGYEGIEYAVINNADIVNCSWGATGTSSSFEQDVIDFAFENGTLVVAAAGNSGINNDLNPHFPSNYKHVLSVGATGKTSNHKAGFSNYGTTVDVFAPGTDILSTTPNNNYSSGFSGTSMASPLAAGLAALVKTQNPAWNVDQVREQVRVSCDNIDDDNPTLIGLLGMGRINALRSVTDFASPAIRLVDLAFNDSGNDGIINAGETIDLTINFTNYLSSTSNVAIQLNTTDDKITMNAANTSFLTFNSSDTLQAIFQFTVATGVPDGYILRFYLDISNTNYQDRDFFNLVVNPAKFALHNTGIIRTAITTQGNIGWIDFKGESGGTGFVFAGTDILFEGGLMLGTSASSVSDCIRGSDQSTQDNNFRPGEGEFLTIISPGQFSHEEGSILLVDSLAPNPLGVSILQKSYADTTNGINNFVIFHYEISNSSGNYISNLHAGLFFDWDIDPQANDWTRYDAGRKMGYVLNSASNPSIIAATRLLTSTANASFRAIHNPNELYDGFTDAEKWNFLSAGIQTQNLDNVDVSTLLSEGPFDLPAGETIEVGFAVIAAKSLSELTIHADKAQDFWNSPPSTIDMTGSVLPNKFGLDQNYPNPFNPSTKIKYQIPSKGRVNLEIFNLLGQNIRTLVDGEVNPGIHEISWDGKDQQGKSVASGIYIYQLKMAGREQGIFTKKMLLIK